MTKNTGVERTTYGYRRIWTVVVNHGVTMNGKTIENVLIKSSLSIPYLRPRVRAKTRNRSV